MLNKHFLLLILLGCYSTLIVSMTYDNRHFPLLDRVILRQDDASFFFRAEPFVFFANSSTGGEEDNDEVALFEIDGKLNQNDWDDVLIASGASKRKFVPPNFSTPAYHLEWPLRGRFDSGGLAFRWYYALSPNWEIGGSWFFMGIRSRLEALLLSDKAIPDREDIRKMKAREISRGDVRDFQKALDEQRRASGLDGFLWKRFGISDLDFYLRLCTRQHYFWRFKTFEPSVKFGFIAPTAAARDINNPASMPFGGDGFWGVYADMALDTELKDDLFAGLNFRFIQRLPRDKKLRLPVRHHLAGIKIVEPKSASGNDQAPVNTFTEFEVPLTFDPLIGTVHVSPGYTFVFSPYFAVTNFRDGFGAQISYTLSLHTRDKFSNLRARKDVSVDLEALNRRSSWASEYVSFGISYDFARDRECRGALPMVFVDVDWPVHFFAAQRSNKTFGVSLRVESNLW